MFLRLGQFATSPSGTEGALYYDTTEKKIKVYSDSAWSELGEGAEPGQLPTYTTAERDALSPSPGLMIYNTDYDQVQTYTKTAWSGITGNKDLGIECASAMDCASGFCVDNVCCDTSPENCFGDCRRCNAVGSMGVCSDVDSDCTGNCDVCSSGTCVASAELCTGNCDICSGSGTAYNCEGSNALCSNTVSSCYCSGSDTAFNCQPCSNPYPSNCGYATCSSYTCGAQGIAADHSGTLSGQTVYCDEHNLLWAPTESDRHRWTDALSICDGLTYAGYSDWVLPNKDVLYQFGIDACGYYACTPSWDSRAQAYYYWSSTGKDTDHAYGVSFDSGNLFSAQMTASYYMRCVRGQ